ncbi:MAG: DUF2318 domain-containing protein [Clostridiales Family XIII bacterium]|jgi:hypothetical protein|nr:DUF2318 domain-containing protein [Clostridiales Family XIII bacterium]
MRALSNNKFAAGVLTLTLALALALASCGGSGAASDDGGSAGGDAAAQVPVGGVRGSGDADGASGDAGPGELETVGGARGSEGSEGATGAASAGGGAAGEVIEPGGALTIDAAAVTEKATFYPLTVDGIYLEVFAVRAPDGTVRTALNTCQVCWNSGYGYYVQEGDEFVCQNCGNRFATKDVEVVHGGCNPVPLTEDYKTVEGDTITIGYDILTEAAPLFQDWKAEA